MRLNCSRAGGSGRPLQTAALQGSSGRVSPLVTVQRVSRHDPAGIVPIPPPPRPHTGPAPVATRRRPGDHPDPPTPPPHRSSTGHHPPVGIFPIPQRRAPTPVSKVWT